MGDYNEQLWKSKVIIAKTLNVAFREILKI